MDVDSKTSRPLDDIRRELRGRHEVEGRWRELKFRAYDIARGGWVDGGYGFHILGEAMLLGGLFTNYRLLELNNIVITQFTGLLDRDGKEIYEADILEHHKYGGVHGVTWIKESAGFFVGEQEWPLTKLCSPHVEVIGNIFNKIETSSTAPRKSSA